MSTILLNTPDSSSRDTSTASAQMVNSTTTMIVSSSGNQTTVVTPNSKNINNNNTGTPESPKASETAIIVPRRIFVGGFPPATSETELRTYFEKFGNVREVKIIRDHPINSKGKYSYGFVTFETDEEAKKMIMLGKAEGPRAFEFRGRYLNVNEAIKKPPFSKLLPMDTVPPGGVVLRDVHGQLFTIQNGYAVIASPDLYSVAQPQQPTPTFPFVVQHPVYLAASAPPAPMKYAHQPAAAFMPLPTPPQSAPVLMHQNPNAPQQVQKNRFVYPPVSQAPFNNGNQLPPTPVASPVNPDSPSKSMMPNFPCNNPAITNLTNPFPSVHQAANQHQPMPTSSPYRWASSTVAGPVTQMIYPGYPTYMHDVNHSYPTMPAVQHHMHPPPTIAGSQMVPYVFSDAGDYSSFSAMDYVHEAHGTSMDRRQPRNAFRVDAGATMKD